MRWSLNNLNDQLKLPAKMNKNESRILRDTVKSALADAYKERRTKNKYLMCKALINAGRVLMPRHIPSLQLSEIMEITGTVEERAMEYLRLVADDIDDRDETLVSINNTNDFSQSNDSNDNQSNDNQSNDNQSNNFEDPIDD
jgi:hypothetical protein